MKLHPEPFEKIKNGSKVIEIRLNDEKRQLMKVGDQIEFALRPDFTDTFKAEITGLNVFKNFKEAYTAYPPVDYGAKDKNEWESMYQYYSAEEEARCGVLCIRLKKLN